MTRLDTNYILRYLLNDNEKMASIAEEAIMHHEVYLSSEVLAETVYVLEGVYGLESRQISAVLIELIRSRNVSLHDKYMMVSALEIFAERKLDFVDCILCAYGDIDDILTFDKKLQKCITK